jgi:hypothetical protein
MNCTCVRSFLKSAYISTRARVGLVLEFSGEVLVCELVLGLTVLIQFIFTMLLLKIGYLALKNVLDSLLITARARVRVLRRKSTHVFSRYRWSRRPKVKRR